MFETIRKMLLMLSQSPQAQEIVLSVPVSRRVARRFVAGERLEDALAAVRSLKQRRMTATLDHLGENITSDEEAVAAADACVESLSALAAHDLPSGVSIKLTHLGLDLGDELALENVRRIVQRAREVKRFVRIDMEGSHYTDQTLAIYRQVRREFDNVGAVVQAYLRRTPEDAEKLIDEEIADLRLVKGAYDEPAEIAFQDPLQIQHQFGKLLERMWQPDARAKRARVAVASHDDVLINYAKQRARQFGIGRHEFEFQFLYGIRRDVAERLVAEGYRMRKYVPYGSRWYAYLMRRLAERPANLAFFLRAVVGG